MASILDTAFTLQTVNYTTVDSVPLILSLVPLQCLKWHYWFSSRKQHLACKTLGSHNLKRCSGLVVRLAD